MRRLKRFDHDRRLQWLIHQIADNIPCGQILGAYRARLVHQLCFVHKLRILAIAHDTVHCLQPQFAVKHDKQRIRSLREYKKMFVWFLRIFLNKIAADFELLSGGICQRRLLFERVGGIQGI